MNAEAVELDVLTKILNGNIQKEVMALSLDWAKLDFKVGDHVVYALDGARGVVMVVEAHRCQVLWEDHFASWEKNELLQHHASLTEES